MRLTEILRNTSADPADGNIEWALEVSGSDGDRRDCSWHNAEPKVYSGCEVPYLPSRLKKSGSG
jgi:hypothetical protein